MFSTHFTSLSVLLVFPLSITFFLVIHGLWFNYSRADWDGLRDHLRDVPWEDIFKLSASAAASEFCEWVQVGIMYISLIVSIRSNLTHVHGFQELVLLP